MGRFAFQIKLYSWYYPTVIGLVFIIGVLSTAYTYVEITSSVKKSLLEHASTVAYALESHHITTLSGSEQDLQSPDYVVLKERLQKIRGSSPDIRFAYLTGYRNGNPFFLADSEPADSPDYSPPGQVYYEGGPGFREPFLSNDSSPIMEDIYSDRWGTWLTAITPIVDPNDNKVIALMSMDMNARLYYQTVFVRSILPAVVFSFVTLLIVIGFVIGKREKRFLEFKSELVSIASHEIRTPLTGISWVTESLLLSHSENLSPEQKEDIQMIKDNSRNLLATINDLLDFSAAWNVKSVKFVKQQLVLFPLVEELAKNFELSMREKNIRLVFDSSFTNDISVFGDRDRLRRLFNNLVSNAIKYSKPDSTITVGCERREKSFVFWIKDQGIGISPKDQDRVFKGFYRAENAKKFTESGTGLGLLYVRQIAELHGGKVWYESKENIGSTFFVEFPKR